ncbi:MAG: hypothetical protein AVDCRST_MAG67-2296 [uncultured Solirubrobacteraceae bacterium]|uniref:Uncharacterized protein n=1 Tax=uncultured Solirubrobacteraceae bacterium TaxID=1162706 RepID=A0A6J4SRA7_9ACTN|nr:MAG: hypothetical protein AVDCRST_MAG67-2296 [uncultured Solirubrobacteraceae bacterium]
MRRPPRTAIVHAATTAALRRRSRHCLQSRLLASTIDACR